MMKKQKVSQNLMKYLIMDITQDDCFSQVYHYYINNVCLNLSEYKRMISNVMINYMLEVQEIEHILMDGTMCVIHYELSITNRKSGCVIIKHIMKLLQFEQDLTTIKASWTYLDQCIKQEVLFPTIS